MVATGQVSNVRESHTVTVMEGIKWQQRDSYSAIIRPAECKLFSNNQEARSKRDSAVITRAWCCMELHTHTHTLVTPHQARHTNFIYHLYIHTIYVSPVHSEVSTNPGSVTHRQHVVCPMITFSLKT